MQKKQTGGGIVDLLTRRKKLGQGTYGKIVTPNYSCKGFKRTKGYVSKLAKGYDDTLEKEIRVLERIKKFDKEQKYLGTMETFCKTRQVGWKYNIVMKNYGKDLMETRDLSADHVFDVFLKQTLHGLYLLHNNNIFHRDMAVRNILYDKEENRYRLIDFGWALELSQIKNVFKVDRDFNIKSFFDRFEEAYIRGDGLQEEFNYPKEYVSLKEMYTRKIPISEIRKEIKKHTPKLQTRLLYQHTVLDMLAIFECAKILTKQTELKKLEKKIDKRIIKFLMTLKIKHTTKEVYDILYKQKK